jgi:electron transfer flavoprotein alpha subunit
MTFRENWQVEEDHYKHGKALVLTEKEGLKVSSSTFELLGAARKIANGFGGALCTAVLGSEIADVSEKMSQFVDEVYSLDHPLLKNFQPELYADALEQLCQKVKVEVVLLGNTLNNLDLAPRLACKCKVDVVTDCVNLDLQPTTKHLICGKPIYGARLISLFKLEKKPYIVTVRSKVSQPIGQNTVRGKVISFHPALDRSLVKVESVKIVQEDNVSLANARAIVAGGRGVQNTGGLEELKKLIKVLELYFGRVELGASRPLVDARLVPSSRQIGLTGEKVAPELYIAVGISGSLQHLTGIIGSKKIIAINTAPKAYIFDVADYGVIGRFEEVIPALRRKLEELQSNNSR